MFSRIKKIMRGNVASNEGNSAAINEQGQNHSTQTGVEIGEGCQLDPSCKLDGFPDAQLVLEGNNYVGKDAEISAYNEIRIGRGTSIQDRCKILGDVEIGQFCVFAPNVFISSGTHHYDYKPHLYIKDQDQIHYEENNERYLSEKVTLKDDIWLGINSVIMRGVTIGKGAVIAANSVVTRDVAPYTVVGGSPAKPIKKRLDFKVKTSVASNNEEDHPYFYEGFDLDREKVNHQRTKGGLRCRNKFTLALEGQQGKQLVLEFISTTPVDGELKYNDSVKNFDANEKFEISFPSTTDEYHEFSLELSDKKADIYLIAASVIS